MSPKTEIELSEYEGLINNDERNNANAAARSSESSSTGNINAFLVVVIILLASVFLLEQLEMIEMMQMGNDRDDAEDNPEGNAEPFASNTVKNYNVTPSIKPPELNHWPNPIIGVGMPKAGTNTIKEYFECGSKLNYTKSPLKISHWRCDGGPCGVQIHQNIIDDCNADPLRNTGNFDVYTQLDFDGNKKHKPCYFPQIENLEEIHAHHPNSTLILNLRNVTAWISSVERWYGMSSRLDDCDMLNSSLSSTDLKLARFYQEHVIRVRNFAKDKGVRLVEVTIDSPYAGKTLEDAFGIPEYCWGHANQNP